MADRDEGYYNNTYNVTDGVYDGSAGMDFDTNLQIDTIDFGTFHLYPQDWSESPLDEWGTTYIQQHIDSMKKGNKPVIMEEFGVTGYGNQTRSIPTLSSPFSISTFDVVMLTTAFSIYPGWFHLAEQGGLGGVMPWTLGSLAIDVTVSPVHKREASAWILTRMLH